MSPFKHGNIHDPWGMMQIKPSRQAAVIGRNETHHGGPDRAEGVPAVGVEFSPRIE